MPGLLLVTDADWLFDEVSAALCGGGTTVSRIHDGSQLRPAVSQLNPDLVILDMQSGSMGGIANCLDLRLEAGAGRLPETKMLLLLDRDSDRWLAREAKADGWMVKPLDSFRLRRAANAILAGEAYFENEPVDEPEAPDEADAEAGEPAAADA